MWCTRAVNEALPTDIEELQQLLHRHVAMVAARDQEIDRLTAIIKALQRHRFGARSEQLDPDQLQLGLEEVEQTVSASEAAQEKSQPAASPRSGQRARIRARTRCAARAPAGRDPRLENVGDTTLGSPWPGMRPSEVGSPRLPISPNSTTTERAAAR